MSKPIPKGTRPRPSTMLFRLFKRGLSELSEIHWFMELGRCAAISALGKGVADGRRDDLAVELIPVDFDRSAFAESASEAIDLADQRAHRQRLYLLVVCAALLETFLQESVCLHVAANGESTADYELTSAGKDAAAGVLRCSDIPELIKCAERAFGLTLGGKESAKERWTAGYKLRCSAAHEAGIVSAATRRKLGDTRIEVGHKLSLDWPTLKSYKEAAFEIAEAVDRKLATKAVLEYEQERQVFRWAKEDRAARAATLRQKLLQAGVEPSASRMKHLLSVWERGASR